ncbi:MAG: TolC family protein [Halioglobus sp.]
MNRLIIGLVSVTLVSAAVSANAALIYAGETLGLAQAVAKAQAGDPWLQGSLLEQQAYEASSLSAATQPDPVMSLGFANLPTDTFDFDQEPMTQFKVGVTQRFARGDTLDLSKQRLALKGANEHHRRADRLAQIETRVTSLWLDAYLAAESVRLIESDRGLFEYLVDVAKSSYTTALGRTRQQDLVRAQLELTLLDDRLALLQQQADTAVARLSEWLDNDPILIDWRRSDQSGISSASSQLALPDLKLSAPPQFLRSEPLDESWLNALLVSHPAVQSMENSISVEQSGIALAEQKFKPQWGVTASYGYRDDDPLLGDRADFFSVGLTIDLPLFTGDRQDQDVQSAIARTEARRSDRSLLLRTLRAQLETQRASYLRLRQRQEIYATQLLGQMREQAQASLTAYTNDDGDFAEVVRARIAELNAKIDALAIDVDIVRTAAQLNYYLDAPSYYTTAQQGVSS